MSWQMFLLGFLPIIIFVVVEWKFGVKWGAVAALILGAIECIVTYAITGAVDETLLVSMALVVVLGLITIKTNNPRFFKAQPVILGLFMAAFLAYYQYFDTPFIIKFMERDSVLIPPEFHEAMQNPAMRRRFIVMNGGLIYVLIAHALMTLYAALKMSSVKWMLVRTIGLYALLIAYSFGMGIYFSTHP